MLRVMAPLEGLARLDAFGTGLKTSESDWAAASDGRIQSRPAAAVARVAALTAPIPRRNFRRPGDSGLFVLLSPLFVLSILIAALCQLSPMSELQQAVNFRLFFAGQQVQRCAAGVEARSY